MADYDVAIIGLGAMGSSTCRELAQRGAKVVAFEQFEIPHDRGSYAGHSRAFRLAYYEHPDYVPLLKRAYQLWKKLEQQIGRTLFIETGGLYVGREDAPLIAGSLTAAAKHDIPCSQLSHNDLQTQYPHFQVPNDWIGIFEPRGGVLLPEVIVESSVETAVQSGATICSSEAVLEIKHAPAGPVRITTQQRTCTADRVVVCSGAWTSKLLGDIRVPLRVSRQTMAWLEAPRGTNLSYEAHAMPMWGWDDPDGVFRYGFPELPDQPGLKIAHHNPGPTVDVDVFDREPTADDEEKLCQSFARVFSQGESSRVLAARTCVYTNTPDEHFIVDHHPTCERIIIAAGFSGHGFKFASVMGEALADLAQHAVTDLPIGFLSLARFVS